jgi:hypothetical protein
MKKRFFLLLAIAVIISACGKPTAAPPTATPSPSPTSTSTPKIESTDTPLPTTTPVCISPEPTQNDIDRALTYTSDIFSAPDWEQSQAVSENTVAVTWQNIVQGAVVYLEVRIKPCGYEEPDLNKDFSDDNWKAIFANYESYDTVAQCKMDSGIRLYQFKTYNQGFEYRINYWAQNDTDTRIVVTMIVFPSESQQLLDDYSIRLFPTLPNCS